jgi:hypothetical protein
MRGAKGKSGKCVTSTRLDPLFRSRATFRSSHHRLERDMIGRGLTNSSTTKSSQIRGHVQGWMMGSPARAKESQKAQQSAASAMHGICNRPLSRLVHTSASPLVVHLKILSMVKTRSNIQLCKVDQGQLDIVATLRGSLPKMKT